MVNKFLPKLINMMKTCKLFASHLLSENREGEERSFPNHVVSLLYTKINAHIHASCILSSYMIVPAYQLHLKHFFSLFQMSMNMCTRICKAQMKQKLIYPLYVLMINMVLAVYIYYKSIYPFVLT